MKAIISYLTLKLIGFAFTDIVTGEPVYKYRDCFNEVWLKNSRLAFFRVHVSKEEL